MNRYRLCLYLTLLCAPLLATVAWLQRLRVFSVLVRVSSGLDVTAGDMAVGWNYVKHLEVTVSLSDLTVYSPREQTSSIATIRGMTVELQREGGAQFSFRGIASVEGLEFTFIAYDPMLADTNVRRLVYALVGDDAAADSIADGSERTLASEPSTSIVTFTRVDLRRVALHASIQSSSYAGAPRVTLPPVTLLDESLSLRMLEAGLSLGVLNFLSSLVVRTLASTSIDTAASTLDGGITLLASAIGRAIDLVDYTNDLSALPGSSLLAGATRGARELVHSAKSAASAVLGGVTGGVKEVVGSKPTPAAVLRGIERGVETLRAGLSAGAEAALDGVEDSAGSLADGVDNFVGSFVPGIGHGIASAAKGGVHVAAIGTSHIANGVLEGGASAIGGTAGGLAEAVGGVTDGTVRALSGLTHGGLAVLEGVCEGVTRVAGSAVRGDGAGVVGGGRRVLDGVLGGGGLALHGLATGAEQLLRGTYRGVSYFGDGVASGAGAVVSGVVEPTEQAVRRLWKQPELCTTHSIYQRTLLSQSDWLHNQPRRAKRQVMVCTSATAHPDAPT